MLDNDIITKDVGDTEKAKNKEDKKIQEMQRRQNMQEI